MAKGFSFVLVSVVMVVMLMFGLLSVSSAGADLRLSEKAADTQQIYYGLDSRGQKLFLDCAGAARKAQADAAQALSAADFRQNPPSDLYACLKSYPVNDTQFRRGVFFYYLSKELATLSEGEQISCAVDESALEKALTSGDSAAAIATVHVSLQASENKNDALNITLQCDFGADAAPYFTKTQWQYTVSNPDSDVSSHLNVLQF